MKKTEKKVEKKRKKPGKPVYRVLIGVAVFLCVVLMVCGFGKWKQGESGKKLTKSESLCKEVLKQANQITSRFQSQKDWYRWAKEYGEVIPNQYCVETWRERGTMYQICPPKENSMDSRVARQTEVKTSDGSTYYATNVQIAGVDEADDIKTDGEYLYILSYDEINIVDTRKELKEVSSIPLEKEEGCYYKGMYVRGEQLIIIESMDTDHYDCYIYWECRAERIEPKIKVSIYDIMDKENPVLEKEMVQDGYYLDSRMKGDYLYLFAEYNTYCPKSIMDYDAYVPVVFGKEMKCEEICVMLDGGDSESLLISAVDVKEKKVVDKMMITSGSDLFYVSEGNIYSLVSDSIKYEDVVKISYQEGNLEYVGKTKVKGTVYDEYFMEEKDGFLRLMTQVYPEYYADADKDKTTGSSTSKREKIGCLYVFDENMKEVGRIDNLAADEAVYNCIFVGDMIYINTYRDEERVVVADLTDPYHPVLAGTMKKAITTKYLQYYGSDKLLGIEYEYDEEREYPNTGLKLTMYDISNPMELKEITSVCIWEGGTFDKDAKELLAGADKNVIGITTHEGVDTYFHWLSFENGEFMVNMKEEDLRYSTRGVYIDDVLYVVNGKEVKAFSTEDGSLVERLELY